MSSGRIVLIAFVTSALTSAGAFFALRAWTARGAASQVDAPPATALRVPPPPAPPAVATEQLRAEDAEVAPATAADSGAPARVDEAAAAAPAGEVVVPTVARKRLAAARRILERAGFKVTLSYSYDEDVSEGRILRQFPPAGSRAPRGSPVRLVVNQDTY